MAVGHRGQRAENVGSSGALSSSTMTVTITANTASENVATRSAVSFSSSMALSCHERMHCSGQELQQGLGPGLRRGRVLASDKPAVGDDKRYPVRCFFIVPAEALQLILHEERHNL